MNDITNADRRAYPRKQAMRDFRRWLRGRRHHVVYRAGGRQVWPRKHYVARELWQQEHSGLIPRLYAPAPGVSWTRWEGPLTAAALTEGLTFDAKEGG